MTEVEERALEYVEDFIADIDDDYKLGLKEKQMTAIASKALNCDWFQDLIRGYHDFRNGFEFRVDREVTIRQQTTWTDIVCLVVDESERGGVDEETAREIALAISRHNHGRTVRYNPIGQYDAAEYVSSISEE